MHLPYKNNEELIYIVGNAIGDYYWPDSIDAMLVRLRIWSNDLYWRKESAGSFNSPDYQIVIYRRGNPVDAFYVCHDREDEAMVLLASRYPKAVEWPEA